MKFVYFFVWCWEWLGDLLPICWCCISGCKSCFVIKMVISSFSFEHVNYIVSETWLWYKDVLFRGSYRATRWILYFEGRIARRDGYYYRGLCRVPRQMHGQICPPWVPDWETAGMFTRSDMHHYTWHCIPLYCTYVSLVNLISCFADLLIAFLRNLWLINIELVIADI